MPRYDVKDLSRSIYLAKEELKEDVNKYKEYLKVAGNNYKYPYIHQLSIYNMDTKATACAEFDYWKSIGRSVKRGEKGIPLLDIESGKIKYIFDIRQTVSVDHNISEVKLWEYDSKKHLSVLDELIDKFKEKDSQLLLSQDEKLDALIEIHARKNLNEIIESLSDESLRAVQKVDFFRFLKESIKISVRERMGISHRMEEIDLSILSKISNSDIDRVLNTTSNLSKNILLDMGKEIKRLEGLEKNKERKDKEQTKDVKERYNKLTTDLNNKINEEINVIEGGVVDERESNTGRQGVFHGERNLHTNNQGESLRETGRDIQNERDGRRIGSFSTQYDNARGNRSEETQSLGENETQLSQGEQKRGLSDHVSSRNLDGSSPSERKRDRGLYQQGRNKDDGSLGTDRRIEDRGLSEIFGTEKEHGLDFTRDSRKGNNINLINEEVKSTSFFSANNEGEQIFIVSPINQKEIDAFLIHGGNHEDGRLPVISEFSKGKSLEEQVNFLKETYKGANGFEIEGRNISVWFGEDGAIFQEGDEARYKGGQVLSWEDMAENINNLLDRGEFASNVEVIESASYEREKIAESLWYLKRDFSDEVKDKYLPTLNQIKSGSFPEETENLKKKLEDKNFISELKKEYETFLEDYKSNPNILRFHYHKRDRIYQNIHDLEIERKDYHSNINEIKSIHSFITQDEIDENLKRGSGFSEGKKRITEFFKENHNIKERVEFLKSEYGTGGSSHALSGARKSDEWHDAKGIKFTKGKAKEIQLSWSNVARRINDLIEKNRYLDEESIGDRVNVDHDINDAKDIIMDFIHLII